MKALFRSFPHCKFAAFGIALAGATLAWSQTVTTPTYNTPLQHIIVVIQENRTPDNLFGADLHNTPRILPGADLAGSGQCKSKTPSTIPLKPGPLDTCVDPDHSHAKGWAKMYDAGKMDDVCDVAVSYPTACGPPPAPPSAAPYQYVDNSAHLIDPYFNIAHNYGYANYLFQTNQGPSFPAHQFLFSGTSAPVPYNDPTGEWTWFDTENVAYPPTPPAPNDPSGCLALMNPLAYTIELDPTEGQHQLFPCYDHPALTDLLDTAKVTWRWYGYDYAPSLWNAPNAISHICGTVVGTPPNQKCSGADWNPSPGHPIPKVTLKIGQLLYDMGDNQNHACNLPNVSWVIPQFSWSDHPGEVPGTHQDGGPSWVAAIVNALGGKGNSGGNFPTQCNYWSNTAVLILWDDWGGWYDHVLPWECTAGPNGTCSGYSDKTGQQNVYGFRVPLLVVSPYTAAGYVSGDVRTNGESLPYVHDFGSILNFIEYAFGQNGQFLGGTSGIGDPHYPYADVFAPDGPNNAKCLPGQCPFGLSDFFGTPAKGFFKTQRAFTFIKGTKYLSDCFINPNDKGCFGSTVPPMGTDSDPDGD
jgi:phospholipase C